MNKNVNIIVEKLKKIAYCEGIVYSGSRTDGDFVATSDYDFTVLIGKGKSYYRIFRYKNLLVDICCATAEVIKKKIFGVIKLLTQNYPLLRTVKSYLINRDK